MLDYLCTAESLQEDQPGPASLCLPGFPSEDVQESRMPSLAFFPLIQGQNTVSLEDQREIRPPVRAVETEGCGWENNPLKSAE